MESETENQIDVFAVDIDNDSDVDILGASEGEIACWENDGSEGFTKFSIAAIDDQFPTLSLEILSAT